MSPAPASRVPRSHLLAAWGLTWLLLLNAAVPMLARLAADLQGKAVGDVCALHGLPSAPHEHHDHHGDAPSDGDADLDPRLKHCPLAALPMLAAPATTGAHVVAPLAVAGSDAEWPESLGHDAVAAWVARLKHGPPSLS